jgi:hypothetical protein
MTRCLQSHSAFRCEGELKRRSVLARIRTGIRAVECSNVVHEEAELRGRILEVRPVEEQPVLRV